MSTAPADFNAQIIDEFRANAGRVGGPFEGLPILLLHHTGAKIGQELRQPARLPGRRRTLCRVRLEGGAHRRTPPGTTTSMLTPR